MSQAQNSPGMETLLETQTAIAEELEDFLLLEPPHQSNLPREVLETLQCIHSNIFDSSFNVTAARVLLGIHNHNISTRFRTHMGTGIRAYIEQLRLRAAASLLGSPDLEIYLISLAVGYDHQETFCRAFHRCFRCTPTTYRDEQHALPPTLTTRISLA